MPDHEQIVDGEPFVRHAHSPAPDKGHVAEGEFDGFCEFIAGGNGLLPVGAESG